MKLLVNIGLGLLLALGAHSSSAGHDVLVYVFQEQCGACRKFDAEVGDIYDQTSDSDILPMVRISLEDWRAGEHPFAQCQTRTVVGTPTFIHLKACLETDRLTGYSSDELFWLAVARMRNAVEQH